MFVKMISDPSFLILTFFNLFISLALLNYQAKPDTHPHQT